MKFLHTAPALTVSKRPLSATSACEAHLLNASRQQPAATDTASPGFAGQPESAAIDNHILIVDDDVGVRHVLEQVLCAAGYRISCAADGEEGWDALGAGDFDLLITDHDMPRLVGLDLLRRLRCGASDLPVILISGAMPWNEADLPELLQPGIALEKPFSFTTLLANVRNLLAASRGRNQFGDGQVLLELAQAG